MHVYVQSAQMTSSSLRHRSKMGSGTHLALYHHASILYLIPYTLYPIPYILYPIPAHPQQPSPTPPHPTTANWSAVAPWVAVVGFKRSVAAGERPFKSVTTALCRYMAALMLGTATRRSGIVNSAYARLRV
jgi:hypothetical protein